MTAVLQTVKDKKTAEAALPKLDAPAKQMLRLKGAFSNLEIGKLEQLQKLWPKYDMLFAAAGGQLEKELDRLQEQPALLQVCVSNKSFREFAGWLLAERNLQNEVRISRAQTDVITLEKAVTAYQVKYNVYPPTLKVLAEAQPDGGIAYIKESMLRDPWGQPYVLDVNVKDPKTQIPLIFSPGPPGQNMPIRNWESPGIRRYRNGTIGRAADLVARAEPQRRGGGHQELDR
jgi:hypothetical protein